MVDVTEKIETFRTARAEGWIRMRPETFRLIEKNRIAKGDVLGVARLAGIQAAKRTWEVIPLCHPLPIGSVEIDFRLDPARSRIGIEAGVKTTGRTGVEMEALTAVAVAALTLYDMCKAVEKGITIEKIRLLEKTGGKSGIYKRKD
ncbi:MAG: cyclic pyranopterin monophosphate synthase MoaC [Nitrospirae bacterium]|nr:cyclic pyranopterin monophosphate synthase MoaC [Nitrospirota bacterium]